ncbi:deoxyribodipyrimidine photo-lyase [Paraliobacillus quinghaiensis]|uniref:Deoxyribodipyrimidine photo-lyase n=1 Tax=Paraliobacillus quinghaiensis TaxID=470815 RepID=A0A917TLD9_9BACI|nr:deoxyribodipyrimidine photo-lyase [Paraliobacillus quinghaiensis]GGM27638.1 deoxyribodipyrimidine photo-lyase [Paraliobacillus quinghaiensis]
MKRKTIIMWFRNDLRLHDNPALYEAAKQGDVLPVFIDTSEESIQGIGSAESWWLHHSLEALKRSMKDYQTPLVIRKGRSEEVLQRLIKEVNADAVYFNHSYEPGVYERDQQIINTLNNQGIIARTFHANVLFVPGTVKNKQGNVYKVFTSFWKQVRQQKVERPVPAPEKITMKLPEDFSIGNVSMLNLIPDQQWPEKFHAYWNPGEKGAKERWQDFLLDAIEFYDSKRDMPALEGVSGLSPHLSWGEISPRVIWNQSKEKLDEVSYEKGLGDRYQQIESYLRQIVWRDFAYHQLVAYPHVLTQPLKEEFKSFPWLENVEGLERWKRGKTGYPLVDAGMRELWETGWMHNRIRMITASFLVKHLLIHWLEGANWFRETLVDHDIANNIMGWQWVAGSGFDSSPYFRVFNPILQGEKFDPTGDYVRKWVPEIASLPTKFIFAPWTAPESVLQEHGITLGETYPERIVDHKAGRERALAAYYEMKEK